MTADPAARWRAGKTGYGNRRAHLAPQKPVMPEHGTPEALEHPERHWCVQCVHERFDAANVDEVERAYQQMAQDDAEEIAARRAARRSPHGRAGALYCGTGDPMTTTPLGRTS